jgi:asparagine synthase (glutamine-hydrolysing)
MSAIVGICYLDGRPVDRIVLDRMVQHVASWPGDDQGVWADGSVGFGHRMLHATPESLRERLPFSYRDQFVITADARIDNRQELIAELSFHERNISTVTDSELILKSYEKWGELCPEHLLGDFSFAIWDPSSHKLFCARDPMAVKPFFYYHSDRVFVFASSISALLQDPEVPRKLNELRLAYFLARIYDDKIITFYKDIVRLPGGHSLVVENGRCQISPYWVLDPEREIRLGSNQEYEEAMREIFFESVRCRLRSDFPAGSMLSGGLDSSSIVCAARKIIQENGSKPLHTFSAIFPESAKLDPRIDERKFIEAVSSLGSVVQHDVIADRCSPLLDILWNQAEPIPAPNFYMDWLIFRNAQKNGMGVMLSGHDGDTIIAYGYEIFAELTRKGRWLSLFRELKAICNLMGWPFWGVIRTFCLRPLVPEPAISIWRFLHGRQPAPMYKGVRLNKTFSSRVGLEDHLRLLHENKGNSPRLVHMEHITAGILSNMNEMLRVAADDSAIDLRFPYFDRRLIEFCLALPLDQKLQNGESRSIMRRTMQGLLPLIVQSRFGKGNLSSNFNKGLLKHGEKLVRDSVTKHMDLMDPYIDLEDLKNSFEKYTNDPLRSNEEAFNLFLVATLIQWIERSGISV